MTYAGDISTLRAPVADNLGDFPPTLWESEGEDVARLATGDRSDPGAYILWRSEYAPGEYLASGGNNEEWLYADIDCRIAVEETAGARASAIIAGHADTLKAKYKNASNGQTVFRTPESYLTPEYSPRDGWLARDWVCPVWIFGPAPEDDLLAGQSANQLTVEQAAHGLAVGDWIGFDGADWVKADADSQAADGICSSVADVDNFTVTTGDMVKVTAHGLTLGKLYLSTTAGAATSTEPDPGAARQVLGKAVTADYILVRIGELLDL